MSALLFVWGMCAGVAVWAAVTEPQHRRYRRMERAAKVITARRCDIFVPPYTCITEDAEERSICDPCRLAQGGVPVMCETGHLWGQPEGVLTRRECVRCGALPSQAEAPQ